MSASRPKLLLIGSHRIASLTFTFPPRTRPHRTAPPLPQHHEHPLRAFSTLIRTRQTQDHLPTLSPATREPEAARPRKRRNASSVALAHRIMLIHTPTEACAAPVSDDESGSEGVPDMIPARGKAKADPEPAEAEAEEEEEEEEEEEDGGEDEYRVEKILKHDFQDDGTVVYQIKWLGYEDASDLTWEPTENIVTGAKEILKAYHKKIGGEPVYEAPPAKSSGKKKGDRASTGGGKRKASDAFAADSPAPTAVSKKKGRRSNGVAAGADDEPGKRVLPQGTWDTDVLRVTSIIEESVPVSGDTKGRGREKESKELIGLLEWRDSAAKTQHKMKVLRQKVPQRLLDYYEQHLVFTHTADELKQQQQEEEEAEAEAEAEDARMEEVA
ncbi:hypothetical protein LTR36_009946 [Oleoguttula mirabilis]|uniref:Chromo domain-containing protein n=1 Tax=Oleoguttula mirabilis TaxID=1507867 RepID=A0AAV9J5H3_9PEZI|nr:hypothetical protein LTR36_009946 [Oleoguttula mirabilis]